MWDWVGLARNSVAAGRIDQAFCRSDRDWSNFLQQWVGLVKILGRIGQTVCRSRHDWSNFLWRWEGLVMLSLGTSRTGPTFSRSRHDWSNVLQKWVQSVKFLREQAELIRIPSGVAGSGLSKTVLCTHLTTDHQNVNAPDIMTEK